MIRPVIVTALVVGALVGSCDARIGDGACYPTVDAALAAGDEEDATCATWVDVNGRVHHGPAHAMAQSAGDVEITP